jgi:hypothetical protein
MKFSAIATMMGTLVLAAVSHADGFKCDSLEGDVRIAVYNETAAEAGTRSASKMVVSNPLLKVGERTLAVFTAEEGNLTSGSALEAQQEGDSGYMTYTGNVDLRFRNVKKSEAIMGAAIADMDALKLDVYFTYGQNLAKGEEVQGLIDLVKRDGVHEYRSAVCTRYLKGE